MSPNTRLVARQPESFGRVGARMGQCGPSIRAGVGSYYADLQKTPAKDDSCSRAMGETPESEVFGVLLRHYRRATGLTQEELAERAGLPVRSIPGLETGEHKP